MNILILGASGFIGNTIFHSLISDHTITAACRQPLEGYTNWKKIDFSKHNNWDDLLENIDLVINAIGIIQGDFDRIQTTAPIELYTNCVKKNLKIIHISAIGAEKDNPPTPFLQSKKMTDDFLLDYKLSKIIYSGIVIGKNGKSTRFFAEISRLPLIPLFSDNPISFIHIQQFAALVNKVVNDFDRYPNQIFAVAKPEPLKDVLSAIKGKNARFISVPKILPKALFSLFPKASIGIFNKASFKMFLQSSPESYEPLFPKVSNTIDANNITSGDALPQLFALLSISFIWILSGIVSLISWDDSYSIMSEIGVNHQLAVLFIWLGSVIDILLGIAVFTTKHRKSILVLQIVTMLGYMLILSIGAPHYWLHPFGVLTKNIPLIALSYYLYQKQ